MRFLLSTALLAGLGLAAGCGSGEEYRHATEPEAPEAALANDVYTQLQEMKRANRNEGPQAVDTIAYLEGIEGYGEEPPVGEHGATYEEIHAGVRELQQQIESGASRQAVDQKLDELIAKAETLPHTVEQDADE